jgi:hypothetical protein
MRRFALSVLCVLAGGCHCGDSLNRVSSTLVPDPKTLDFGNQPLNVTASKTFTITNDGSVVINVSGAVIQNDARGTFSVSLAATTLQPGQQATVTVNYLPKAVGADSGTAVVNSDSGAVNVPLTGTGIDLCAGVNCAVTGQGAVAACAGTCLAGVCQYPTGACSDPTGCLTNGTCDGHGHCSGNCYGDSPACCTNPPGPTCSDPNTLLTTNPPGHCDGAGNCSYTLTTVTPCTCGCSVQTNGVAACNFHWALVQGAPTGAYASVWADANDNLWVSVINGQSSTVNPQAIWNRNNGTWTQVGTVNFGENPQCSGPGCGLLVTGDGSGNIYGAADCKDSTCSAAMGGGVWHDANATITDEWFVSPGHSCGGVTNPNIPLSPVVSVGGVPYAIDNDPCGAQIISGSGGNWVVAHAFTQPQCQAPGGFWASDSSNFFMAWGCGPPNGTTPGGLFHWNGQTSDPGFKAFAFPSSEYVDAIFGSSSNEVWAVGTHRWHCTSNCGTSGATWTQDSTPMPGGGGGVDQALWGNGSDYYAGGAYLNIYHWTQASGTWAEECIAGAGVGTNPTVYSIWGDGASNVYAATSIGLMKRQ